MTDIVNNKNKTVNYIFWSALIFFILGIILLFGHAQQTDQEIQQKQKSSRHLSGIFKLPADGSLITKDTSGRELRYQKGEHVRFEQIGSPGKFTVVNQRPLHGTWSTNRVEYTSARTQYSDKIQLRSSAERELLIQTTILSRRRS